jgi:hypothetical protein
VIKNIFFFYILLRSIQDNFLFFNWAMVGYLVHIVRCNFQEVGYRSMTGESKNMEELDSMISLLRSLHPLLHPPLSDAGAHH